MTVKVASLFSGVGGLDWGFEKNQAFQLVFANEMDPKACETYRHNFPGSSKYLKEGDIAQFIGAIPEHNLLLGGFPCQAFSLAGRREGIDDESNRGVMVLHCADALSLQKPDIFVFENVGGILSHDAGKTVKEIVELFEGEGYKIHYEQLVMTDYGVPQRRKRVLFFGVRYDLSHNPADLVPPKQPQTDLTLKTTLKNSKLPNFPTEESILNHNYHVGNGVVKPHWISVLNEGENLKDLSKEEVQKREIALGLEPRKKPSTALGYRRLNGAQIAPTMMFGNTCLPIHPWDDRSISVREAAYIQSFPLDFEFKGGISAQYKQVGNAVPPKFSEHLAKHLVKFFPKNSDDLEETSQPT